MLPEFIVSDSTMLCVSIYEEDWTLHELHMHRRLTLSNTNITSSFNVRYTSLIYGIKNIAKRTAMLLKLAQYRINAAFFLFS